MTGHDLPAPILRRIRMVVDLERRLEEPCEGVCKEELAEAVTSVLRLVLRLRAEQ